VDGWQCGLGGAVLRGAPAVFDDFQKRRTVTELTRTRRLSVVPTTWRYSTRTTAGGGVNRLSATRTEALNAQYAIAGGAAEPHTRARGSRQDWCCFNATLFLLLHQCHTRFFCSV
jgi:hypothetical protein